MRNRTVIVEGMDGTGKSTLVQELAKRLGRVPTHTGGPSYSQEDLLARMDEVEEFREGLFDRCCHISNYIYATADARPAWFSKAAYLARLNVMDPIVVHCSLGPDFEVLRRNVSKEVKPHKPPEYRERVLSQQVNIYAGYEDYFDALRYRYPDFRVREYDYRSDDLNELCDWIEKCAAS